jgi:hypothetical protein
MSRRTLETVLVAAFAVSIVHYVDNVVNYDEYPQLDSGPAPSQGVIAFAWFAFTAFGVAGYLLYRRGRTQAAALCLAVYSGSGLIGILHYVAPGMTDAPLWRQAHVIADIVLGATVLVLALRMVERRPARA